MDYESAWNRGAKQRLILSFTFSASVRPRARNNAPRRAKPYPLVCRGITGGDGWRIARRHELFEIPMIALCTVLCGGQTAADMHTRVEEGRSPGPISSTRAA